MIPFIPPNSSLGMDFRDWQHAARLYVDDTYRLAPKPKFLHYAVFNINPAAIANTQFQQQNLLELNYLVKKMDLPKYTLNVENLNQYNRKTKTYTSITYDPVNIALHDDNNGVTNGLWALYYGYYFADRFNSAAPYTDINPPAYQVHTYDPKSNWAFRYGLDNDIQNPFFTSIQLLTLSRHKFTSYLLCNPKILSWEHDTMDQSDGAGVVENNMSVAYDAVIYSTGIVAYDNPTGFGVLHYDSMESPLNPVNQLLLTGTTVGGIYDSMLSPNNIPLFNPVDFGISTLQQTQLYPFSGNQIPYGYGSAINLNPPNNPYTTSGLQNYNFGTTVTSQTLSPTNVVTNQTFNTITTAPVDAAITTSKSTIEQSINSQFSSTTNITTTAPVITDAYTNNLPKNTPAATESQVFGNINSGRTLPEPTGAVNINYFIQGNATITNNITTSEIISNNPQTPDVPANPFA